MQKSSCPLSLGILAAIFGATVAAAAEPIAVSPGHASKSVVIEGRCPSFSWSLTPDAVAYELVVYKVGREADEPEPVLQENLPSGVSSWTPSLDRCLDRGIRYGWSVRAVDASEASAWSEPRLFEVDAGPSVEEMEAALDVIRRYGKTRPRGGAADEEPTRPHAHGPAGLRPIHSSSVITEQIGTAALTVAGEVRTVDGPFDLPRLWGRGRDDVVVHGSPNLPGGVCFTTENKLGLSRHAVNWGSAADACPAGTWVCRLNEVASCNTDRFDIEEVADARACDGTPIHFPSNDHQGWVSTANFLNNDGTQAIAWPETAGERTIHPSCTSLPVWCCWE